MDVSGYSLKYPMNANNTVLYQSALYLSGAFVIANESYHFKYSIFCLEDYCTKCTVVPVFVMRL